MKHVPFCDLAPMTAEVWPDIETGWREVIPASAFIGGDAVDRFEERWAAYCGTTHAVGVANGTDALLLSLLALDIGPGDEVVVPANGFVAAPAAVARSGAVPRFADVRPDTLLMSAETARAAMSPCTKAIIAVHLFGQPADMDELNRLADATGLRVIEDAAQAHGATWRGRPVGSLGDVACFSFYPGKNLGAFGDAGAITTSDDHVARRIRSLANHGRSAASRYEHEAIGLNSRLDALQAVVLTAKLTNLAAWNAARRDIAARYRAELQGFAPMVAELPQAEGVHHLAVVRVPDRPRVQELLRQQGIETSVHYPVPCHQQEGYRRFADGALPVAEVAAGQILSLPIFPHMSAGQVDTVVEELVDAVRVAHRYVA